MGLICAGELLTRTFTFVNTSGETLKIASDSDITVGCGCTSLVPSTRTVEPGGEAKLVLTIRTDRLDGNFRYASAVRWTGESGREYIQRMTVVGQAAPLVTVSPDAVTFAPGEIGPEKTKVVVVTGNQFVSLKNWRAVSNSTAFSVIKVDSFDDRRTANVHVALNAGASIGPVTGTISVLVDIEKCDRRLSTEQVSVDFPVKGGHFPDFSITPSKLVGAIDPNTRRVKGRFLLRLPRETNSIESVQCGKNVVLWNLASSSSGTYVLTVEIDGLVPTSQATDLWLSIRGRSAIKIPVIVSE